MVASAVLAVAAPLVLVVLALLLAAIKEHRAPCRPRHKLVWRFLQPGCAPTAAASRRTP